jgi:hypothetical protein
VALQGSIKDFGLPDIFQLIGLQRKTGVLTLTHGGENVTVTFENGMVVNADSSAKRIEDRLGNLLVKQGRLSEEKLEEVLQKQKATLQRLGHILTSGGYISQKDLQTALQVQVSQNVFKLFRWKEGDYNFEQADKVEYERASVQPMSADFILMEGIRMVDEWPIIEKKIPSLDIVFKTAVDTRMIEAAGGDDDDAPSGGSKGGASSKIRLSNDEERVFRKVDGVRTVQGVIDATGMGDFDTCKALFDLLSRSIIAPTGRGAATQGGVAAREERASPAVGYAIAAVALVLALAGAAFQRNAPFGVLGRPPLLSDTLGLYLEEASRARLDRLDRALEAFRLANGTLPATLDDVVSAGLVDKSFLKDPWARPYHYEIAGKGYALNAVDDAGKAIDGTLIQRSFETP